MKTTQHLESILLNTKSKKNLHEYLQHIHPMQNDLNFCNYFNNLEKVKEKGTSEVCRLSGIERTYCYHILNGSKDNPGRDKIIRLCLAAQLSFEEAQGALKASGNGILYFRNKRDAIITYAINQSLSINETNDLLDHYSLLTLN